MRVSIGYDPEVLLKDLTRDRIVSAIPVLKRNKYDPIDIGDGARLYYDNVLAEFAAPPSFSPDEAIERFRKVFHAIFNFLGSSHTIHAQAAHTFDKDQLDCEDAWAIGCDPNFDPYAFAANPKREFDDGMRTGSFHIHLGHEKLVDTLDKANAAKLMDVFLGCASVIFDKDPTALARRKYYGRAGEFRTTDYGVEYRCLGNYPLRSKELTKLVFDITYHAASHITNGTMMDVLNIKGIQRAAQIAINCGESTVGRKVLQRAGMPAMLMARVEQDYTIQASMQEAWA